MMKLKTALAVRATWDSMDDGDISDEMLFSMVGAEHNMDNGDVAEALSMTRTPQELGRNLQTEISEFLAPLVNKKWTKLNQEKFTKDIREHLQGLFAPLKPEDDFRIEVVVNPDRTARIDVVPLTDACRQWLSENNLAPPMVPTK